MIDSHCHLDHEPLLSDLANVIQRSKDVCIKKLLTISTSFESFSRIKDLIKIDEMIYGTIGIHPHESSKDIITSDEIIKNLKENEKIIGIGETGLDFYYNNSEKEKQISSFKEHIEASIETDKPLIVHSRDAEKETFDILNEYKNEKLKILMHCFTGSKEFSEKLLTLNSYFSASGIITFKNSLDLQNTFKSIPIDIVPKGLSGPGPITAGHSGLRSSIDGVGRHVGPTTFWITLVRPRRVSSSVSGTLEGYSL